MPTEPLRIKGQYFNLRTELSVSPTKGYKPLSREVTRFPAFPIALDVTLPPTKETNCLKEVSEILGLNIVIVELNFLSANIISKHNIGIIDINIQPLIIAKRVNVNINAIAAALKIAPVLASSKKDQDVNKQILDSYMQLVSPTIKKIDNVDFIVLTGEMVWSGWLTNNAIAYLISELNLINNNWNIDKFGLWEIVAHNTIKDKFIRSISKYYLAPNAFSYKPDKLVKKVLIHSQNESRSILIDGKSRFVENVKGWELGITLLPESLIILGKEYNYDLGLKYDDFSVQKRFKPIVRQGEITVIDKDIKLNIKPGSEIKYGDVIGVYNRRKYKVIKLKDYPMSLKMLVGHGQRVEQDEVIAVNNSLSGKVFNEKFISPMKGIIDLTHKDEGLLFIWSTEEGTDEFMSVFEGRYVSGRVGKYHQFYSKMTDIPLDLNLGKQASGVLTSGSEKIKARYKKILLIDNIKKATLEPENLVNEGVQGIIFASATYEEINNLIEKYPELFDILTVAFVDAFSMEINRYYWEILLRAEGCMATIDRDFIRIVINKIPDDKFEQVRLFSYSQKFRYYDEMRKITPKRFLLANGKEIIEADICNLLF